MDGKAPRRAAWRRWWLAAAALPVAVAGAVAWGEGTGWPLLAGPTQWLLSKQLGRAVKFVAPTLSDGSAWPTYELGIIGGIRLRVARLEVAAPDGSQTPRLLLAHELALGLRYVDLWRFARGQRLRIDSLQARQMSAHIERLADGRASWALAEALRPHPALPVFGHLWIQQGHVLLRDSARDVELHVRAGMAGSTSATVLRASATGRYDGHPVVAEMVVTGVPLAHAGEPGHPPPVLSLRAAVGRARLSFDGHMADPARMRNVSGRFVLQGPSLAAVGDPLGLTLPTTAAFVATGVLVHTGSMWHVVVNDASIGSSHLGGAFVYRTDLAVPLLSGRLEGRRLALVDLGPALGVVPTLAAPKQAARKLLTSRPFDLASLRRMDANVLVDLDEADLDKRWLEPLQRLRAHLLLSGGVLRLQQVDAHMGQGRLSGDIQLDGSAASAQWRANVRWSAVRLERWIHPVHRNPTAPPFVSGLVDATATLAGRGRSTAEILGSLQGQVRMDLRDGTVSHLAVEAAGLDLAQGLGVWMKVDDALSVTCAVADRVASEGVLRPRLAVLDTKDSVLWLTGSLSLAGETLDLGISVAPKDFSPLALRAPLHARGSSARPVISLQDGALERRAGVSLLLAALNPVTALIPFVDPGDKAGANQGAADCRAARRRGAMPLDQVARLRSPPHGPAPAFGLP